MGDRKTKEDTINCTQIYGISGEAFLNFVNNEQKTSTRERPHNIKNAIIYTQRLLYIWHLAVLFRCEINTVQCIVRNLP